MEGCSETLTEYVSDTLMKILFTSKRKFKFKALLQVLYLNRMLSEQIVTSNV